MKTTPKERRQVEIVALVQDQAQKHSVRDLCEYFSVETATIQRDLQELRSLGIPVHSSRGTVRLARSLTQKELQLLLRRFTAFCGEAVSVPKSTALLAKKQKSSSLSLMAELVAAIERRKVVEIKYYKMYDDNLVTRVIEPYLLFPSSRDWILLARSDRIFKHFLLQNIKGVKCTMASFRRDRDFDPGDLHRLSFEYWSGDEVHEVELKFSKKVAHVITNGIWGEDQEILPQTDGSVILRMRVNSLEQLGNWVLTWGSNVQILSPRSLVRQMAEKAKGFVDANSSTSDS
jgi:predicted DNA-binding transcriptional regulator YafY